MKDQIFEIKEADDKYLCCVEEVGDTVKRIVRNFQMVERDKVKPLGFTMTQAYCLIELIQTEGLTMQELSQKMNLNTSTMTRIIDKLVRDKYISRSRNPDDRRIVMVGLTESGLASAKKLEGVIHLYYEEITKNLPVNKVDEVLEAVNLLMEAFEKANPNCC